jgi:hypothetical protein
LLIVPKPSVWTVTAESILTKVRRGRVALINQSANDETQDYVGHPRGP